MQLISDVQDVKDILVRIQHKQFEFSTDLENLKTNQTGETRLTIVTTVNIYHCQKVENIYNYEKNILLGNIYVITKNIYRYIKKYSHQYRNANLIL